MWKDPAPILRCILTEPGVQANTSEGINQKKMRPLLRHGRPRSSWRVLPACRALATGLALMAAGCQHPGFARAQWDSRVERMKYPLRQFAAAEARRPEKLRAAFDWIEQSIQNDAEKFERDLEGVGAWFQRDVDRFQARQRGPYQRGLEEFFGGKPQNIEPNAIQMFF